MRRIIVGLGLLVVSRAAIAAAQAVDSVDHVIGTDVRFRSVRSRDQHIDWGWTDGRIVALSSDTVRVRVCAQCREPFRDLAPMNEFEIQHHVGLGASRVSNMQHGAVFAAIAGLFYTGSLASRGLQRETGGWEWLEAPLWSAGGAVIGALVGAVLNPGRWERWPRQ